MWHWPQIDQTWAPAELVLFLINFAIEIDNKPTSKAAWLAWAVKGCNSCKIVKAVNDVEVVKPVEILHVSDVKIV